MLSFPLHGSPEATYSRVATAVAAIESNLAAKRLPICWNFPAAVAFDRSQQGVTKLRDTLLRRIDENGDSVCPMGLTGAPHRALTVEEMECDLAWAEKNIWGTGVYDALRRRPPLIMPCDGDAGRFSQSADSADTARETGDRPVIGERPGIGIRLRTQQQQALLLVRSEERHLVPIVDWKEVVLSNSRGMSRRVSRTLRRARATHLGRGGVTDGGSFLAPIVLWLDLGSDQDAEEMNAIAALIGEVAEEDGVAFSSWPLLESLSNDTEPIDRAVLHAGSTLLPYRAIKDAAAMRNRRKSKINTRRLLETLGTVNVAAQSLSPAPKKVRARAQREYVASMMGEARLAGPGVDALFVEGRFCGLVLPQESARTEPTDTLIAGVRHGGTSRHPAMVSLATTSCFSFESAISHGLKVVESDNTALPGATITVTTDYSFVSDLPILVISPTISIEWAAVGRPDPGMTLLLMALPVDAAPVVVSSVYPDESLSTSQLHSTAECSAVGSLFSVTHRGQEIHLAAVSRSYQPLIWPLSMVPGSPARLAAGGRFPLDDWGQESEVLRYSVLLAYDPDGAGVLLSVLNRKLPQLIRDEIASGP